MLISELTKNTDCRIIGSDCDISRIEYDSRKLTGGELFCCIRGTFKDGHEFAESAVARGAAALLVERELPLSVPQIIVKNSRHAMAELAIEFYGHPLDGIPVIGITGTNGKTTTTYMIKAIAEKAGYKVGLIGTIRNLIGDRIIPTDRTTPESVELQRVFRLMRDEGVQLIVMEVSSHALDQDRVHGIEYLIGGFTNLTQDHLDYHKTFENYLAAKKIMFTRSKFAVMNADDSVICILIDKARCCLRQSRRAFVGHVIVGKVDDIKSYVAQIFGNGRGGIERGISAWGQVRSNRAFLVDVSNICVGNFLCHSLIHGGEKILSVSSLTGIGIDVVMNNVVSHGQKVHGMVVVFTGGGRSVLCIRCGTGIWLTAGGLIRIIFGGVALKVDDHNTQKYNDDQCQEQGDQTQHTLLPLPTTVHGAQALCSGILVLSTGLLIHLGIPVPFHSK